MSPYNLSGSLGKTSGKYDKVNGAKLPGISFQNMWMA